MIEFVDKEINEALEQELAYEATTSNIYKRLTDGKTCAIISPYRGGNSEAENKQRMIELKADVRDLKLGFNQFISRWVANGEAFDEQSLLIPNIPDEKAFALGKKYGQCSIIFKDTKNCREVCTTEFKDEGAGKVYHPGDIIRVFYNNGNHILNIEEAKEIFAKRKGGPVSKPIKGNRPFTLKEKEASESFELYEVESPRPSYFQNKERHIKIF